MDFTNSKSIQNALMKEITSEMDSFQNIALEDLKRYTVGYYDGSTPKVYKRTGALGKTPRTTSVTSAGNQVSFEAYLDQSHHYTTGDNPTMGQVLDFANYGIAWKDDLNPVLGNPYFWDDALEEMERHFKNGMKKRFP